MSALSRLVCAASLASAAFVVLGATPGCDREDLVVATVSADDAGDGGSGANDSDAGTSCFDDDDCLDGEVCNKMGCGARGVCQPFACDSSPLALSPSCGCNKVSYYNECTRETHGDVSELAPFECQDKAATLCGGDEDCPANAICFHRAVGSHVCGDDAKGTCWVVPSSCASVDSDGAFYRTCSDLAAPCMNLCAAVSNRQPVFYDMTCSPP